MLKVKKIASVLILLILIALSIVGALSIFNINLFKFGKTNKVVYLKTQHAQGRVIRIKDHLVTLERDGDTFDVLIKDTLPILKNTQTPSENSLPTGALETVSFSEVKVGSTLTISFQDTTGSFEISSVVIEN